MTEPLDLAAVYDEHAAALFGFVLNVTRSEADTHDVLQSLFVKLATRPALLAGASNPRAYLLRLAHNLAVDVVRRREARERAHQRAGSGQVDLFEPTNDADEATCRRELTDALAELPPDQRAVVHLRLWEGLTFETIADTLQIPLNTAASSYRYGIDKLRARLRPIYEEIK